jgi:hypothetical protein
VKPGGLLIIDPLTVIKEVPRSDLRVVKVPTAEIAMSVGNKRFQNMVALGALAALTGVIPKSLQKRSGPFPPRPCPKSGSVQERDGICPQLKCVFEPL